MCTATLRQLIATHPSLTTLNSYLNVSNSLLVLIVSLFNSKVIPMDCVLEDFLLMSVPTLALQYQIQAIRR